MITFSRMKNSDKKCTLKRKHAQIKISREDIKYLKANFVSIEYYAFNKGP